MNNDLNNNNQGGMVLGNIDTSQPNNMPETPIGDTNTIENLGDSQVLTGNVNPATTSNNGMVMDGNTVTTPPVQEVQTPPQTYTNPQTINPAPQATFQPQNTIGITPPVSLEPEKKQKKPMNKTLFVILIIVVLLGVGFGTYYILNYTDLLTKKEEIIIETKNLEFELGASLPENIAEYATITGTNVSNCNPVDATEVNMSVAGVYKYTITCGNVSKNGIITVVDNSEIIVQTKTVYKSKGQTLQPSEFIAMTDENLTYEFVSQDDVNSALENTTGTYSVALKVSNGSKEIEVTAKLKMLENPVKGYVTCKSNPQTVDSISASKVVAEEFGILDDSDTSYAGFGNEITTFTITDSTIYDDFVKTYEKEGSVTIDGVTGITKFTKNDDGTSEIEITTELDNSKVLSDYGEDNMKNYGSIVKYFGKTANGLGYSCTYRKAS